MSAKLNAKAEQVDPENRLLWRFNRKRLTAEETRDSILHVSTGIDSKMFGTLLKAANRSYVTGSSTTITDEYKNQRRSVYLPVVRSSVYEVFQTLDFPDPAMSAGARQTSTIAPQALMMMNSELVEKATTHLASGICKSESNDEARLVFAYQKILGRNPDQSELKKRSCIR